ncbi:hypothetical protein [Streptomyces sp. NPDC026589]|uniref:hypothetical protein n=1 Tax=Streptomyces sp. NPDC026589 TaxID=3155609 RepID=UPI0033CB5940
MTHLDSDPDRIRVCDMNADGHGVYGVLTHLTPTHGMQPVAFVKDGGDADCGYVKYSIERNGRYQMQLCWKDYGGDPCTASPIFTE